MIDKLNVRVYATIVKENKVLVLHEEYAGEQLVKFPGGGLELGEGLIDCVQREIEEELNVKIRIKDHLYTQDHFVASRFRENEQLLTIYYDVEMMNEEDFLMLDPCIERIEWLSLDVQDNPFKLPVDQIVFEKLKQKYLP